jgi:hypothetical protein
MPIILPGRFDGGKEQKEHRKAVKLDRMFFIESAPRIRNRITILTCRPTIEPSTYGAT